MNVVAAGARDDSVWASVNGSARDQRKAIVIIYILLSTLIDIPGMHSPAPLRILVPSLPTSPCRTRTRTPAREVRTGASECCHRTAPKDCFRRIRTALGF